MKKIVMSIMVVAISSQSCAISNPFKGISFYSIKRAGFLWLRPLAYIPALIKQFPIPVALVALGGVWLGAKDKRAAGVYFLCMYYLLKYNIDKNMRYNSAHEYFERERPAWHRPRLDQESLDPLDRVILDRGGDWDDLHEYEQVLVEMANLDEVGGTFTLNNSVQYTQPCGGCAQKISLPFQCPCGLWYCVSCGTGLHENNRCKCRTCNTEMMSLVDYFY